MKLGPAFGRRERRGAQTLAVTPFSALLIAEAWQRADLPPACSTW